MTYTHLPHGYKPGPLSFSFTHTSYLQHYLLYSPYTHSYLSIGVLCFTSSPSCHRQPQCQCVKFGIPLNQVNPDVPRFQILVRTFGVHNGVAVKHTSRPLVNPLTSIHGQHSVWHQTRDPSRKLASSLGSYDKHRHSTATPKSHCGDGATP